MATDSETHDKALPASSKLGTKEYWESVYSREVDVFRDIGDEGEVWFGEESAEEMCEWVIDHYGVSVDATRPTVLDVGCGNAHLLLLLLEAGYPAKLLTGVDYSEKSIELSKAICAHHEVEGIDLQVADIINDDLNGRKWDLVTDKGTFDAIALHPVSQGEVHPADLYPIRVARLVADNGGILLITSCNFTQEELLKRFVTPETGLKFHSDIPRSTFQFAGAKGQAITTVAFIKNAS